MPRELTSTEQIGIIGYGAMGEAIGGHLQRVGHPIMVMDTDPERRRRAESHGAKVAYTADEMACRCSLVLILVGHEGAVRDLISDEGPFAGSRSVAEYVCVVSTVRPSVFSSSTRLSRNGRLLDTPVCRALEGAIAGNLLALMAGRKTSVAAVDEVFAVFCTDRHYVSSDVGQAQILKTVNNIMLWGSFMALEEAIELLAVHEIDVTESIEVLASSSADSWALRHFASARDLKWSRKDLEIAVSLLDEVDSASPLTRMLSGLVRSSRYLGHAD